MTYEQKLQAIQALVGGYHHVGIHMRHPGDWYLLVPGVSIGGNGFLVSVGGNGTCPSGAVEDWWTNATVLKPSLKLIVSGTHASRRSVRWNGFMWMDAVESEIFS